MLRSILRTVALLVVAWLVLCGYYYLAQDRFIFQPTPAVAPTAPAEDVRLDVGGATLAGWRVNSDAAIDVVYFGGNAEAVSLHARRFAEIAKARTLLMDYRGYGRSSGAPAEAALVSDAVATVTALTDPRRPLLLVGRSLGTGVAALAAARLGDRVDALTLVSPFCSFRNVAARLAPAVLPARALLRHPFDVAAVAAQLPVRLTLVIAGRDEIVRPEESYCLAAAAGSAPAAVVELPDRGHNDVFDDPALWTEIRRSVEALGR
jgi:pimeloyl-ACP methyl ester carboxylesterase